MFVKARNLCRHLRENFALLCFEPAWCGSQGQQEVNNDISNTFALELHGSLLGCTFFLGGGFLFRATPVASRVPVMAPELII